MKAKLLAGLISLSGITANALDFEFSGTLTSWRDSDVTDNPPAVGTPISGRFTLGSSSGSGAGPTFFYPYTAPSPLLSVVIRDFGRFEMLTPLGMVEVRNGPDDWFSMHFGTANFSGLVSHPFGPPSGPGYFQLNLRDASGNAISSDSIPQDFNIGDWPDTHELFVQADVSPRPTTFTFTADITDIRRVPESVSSFWSLLMALACLLAIRLRFITVSRVWAGLSQG